MKALVTGVSGQDGFYMAQRLLGQGFVVLGLTSNLQYAVDEFACVANERLNLKEFDYRAEGQIQGVIEDFAPDLVFNFAAKATGQGMFDAPAEMTRLNGGFAVEILEALRRSPRRDKIGFCQASSSEMFGNVTEAPQSELTPLRPKSPYGVAKTFAHHMINVYRSTYGVRGCSAILYNHESVRRSVKFVTRKIAHGAAVIKLGLARELTLGSLQAQRDWGFAPEYVDAMYRMATAAEPEDFVIATGKLSSVQDLCAAAFGHVGLDFREFIKADDTAEQRVIESTNLQGDPSKANSRLDWRACKSVGEIMTELVDFELEKLRVDRG